MDALLTPEQVADRLQLTAHTVYVWLRDGRLPGIKLGHRWRVKREDLEAYLDRQRPPRTSAVPPEVVAEPKPIWQLFEENMSHVPEEEWQRLPKDLCDNLDHYLYGHPKREPQP